MGEKGMMTAKEVRDDISRIEAVRQEDGEQRGRGGA